MLPHGELLDSSIFEDVFESTSNPILITDHQGFVLRANRVAAQMFTDETKIGVPFWKILELDCNNLSEALELFSAPEDMTGDIKKSCTYKTTLTVHDIKLVVLGNSSEGRKWFLLHLNDITCMVTKRAELEQRVIQRTSSLERSQKMLQAVFQGVGKGIILVDEDREVVDSNQKACEIFGIHTSNMIGVNICSLCCDTNKEAILKLLDTILENQTLSSEFTALYYDKSIFPAIFTISVIIIDGLRLWIVIVEDVSEQKRMEQQLKDEKTHTEEVNITLRNVLKNMQNEQRDLTDKLSRIIANDILPTLNKIKSASTDDLHNGYIDFVGTLLVSLTNGSEAELNSELLRLSKTEMKICKFIQAGFSSKEICNTMNLAFDTIQTHRKNIRKKLGLAGSGNISLYGYLTNQKLA